MNDILGPEGLVFGVDDVAACTQFLLDYGLTDRGRGRLEALDGTYIQVSAAADPALPAVLPSGNRLRKTIYGVRNAAALDAIATELGRDRTVRALPDGGIEALDDAGLLLGFAVTQRRTLSMPAERINAPGDTAQRPLDAMAVPDDGIFTPQPRTLSHVVYYVPDTPHAEAFYVQRLGFAVTDRMTSRRGPCVFLRPAGMLDHHSMFMMQAPAHLMGCEHFTFHLGGPTELMAAGARLVDRGYQSFWGPGRHRFASNWFWYFNSPLGCHVEYDADMDRFGPDRQPRTVEMSSESAQSFLFVNRKKWFPGDGAPGPGQHG